MFSFAPNFAKILIRLSFFAAALLAISYLPQVTLAQQTQNDTLKAADMLAQVNQWRLDNGLWPLAVNPTLDALALAQANFVLPFLPIIQNEEQYHLDAKLRNPRQRAAAAGWPSYGTITDRIEVGENAGVGSAKFVLNFWRNSAIHAKAALSTTYREVGIAALPSKNGYLYIMDFGARPGVLPVLVNADGTQFWLTDEQSRYAKSTTATQVRLLDDAGNPLTGLINWQAKFVPPDGVPDTVQVLYSYGGNQITTIVNRRTNIAVLPGTVAQFIAGQSAIAATATLQPTVTPLANTIQPTATLLASTVQPTTTPAVVAVNPTLVPATRAPDATPTIPAVPTVDPATADIVITYNANSLFLRNNSTSPVDVSGLSLLGSGVTVGMPLWSRLAEFPSTAFPPSHCVAIQLINTDVPFPSNCKWMRSIINLTPAKIFWTLDNFIVSLNGTTLVTCKPGDGICAIDLP